MRYYYIHIPQEGTIQVSSNEFWHEYFRCTDNDTPFHTYDEIMDGDIHKTLFFD